MKHLLSINDLSREDILELVSLAESLKLDRKFSNDLKNKNIILLFEKPSLRTRVSFEVAIAELNGKYYHLEGQAAGIGKREAVKDIAKVLSRYVQACIIRTFKQADILEFSQYASIPVINALTDLEHPCQILSDLLTIKGKINRLSEFKIAFIGDGNNVSHSLIQAAAILGFDLSIATPSGYEPKDEILIPALKKAEQTNAKINVSNNVQDAVKNADFIYTDVWTSMGQEKEKHLRKQIFKDFQINEQLLSSLSRKCYIMHCLPAHRGEEITDKAVDSEHSIVIDQAENRLHMHKAILIKLFS
ncbi:MAG: ornithine carbamoyltransferase [Candidatus Saelkia tenebricola]|nr:ornithine carbamoyltransferase [Candidatus Saelkia tenebricola]